MTDLTLPAAWLDYICKKQDERAARLETNWAYAHGQQRPPESHSKTKAAARREQEQARSSHGGLVINSLAYVCRLQSVTVAKGEFEEAQDRARAIFLRSRAKVTIANAFRLAFTFGESYVQSALDDGRAYITAEDPRFMYGVPHPLRPWELRAAGKAWRDEVLGMDYLRIWTPGWRQDFTRTSRQTTGKAFRMRWQGGWIPFGEPVVSDDVVPVFRLENLDGMGEAEPFHDIIDRISAGTYERRQGSKMQAFFIRWITGLDTDPDNPEDVETVKAISQIAPNAFLDMPNGAELHEGKTTDIRPQIEQEGVDVKTLSAKSHTPLPIMASDNVNQSAEGARQTNMLFYAKAAHRIDLFDAAIAGVTRLAIRQETSNTFNDTVQIVWEDPNGGAAAELMAAAVQARTAGLPQEYIVTRVLGESPETAADIKRMTENESFIAALANPGLEPTPVPVTATGTATPVAV